MANKIYTKTGDLGKTSLRSGQRVSKADLRVEAYGNLDELNSVFGVVVSFINREKIKLELEKVQADLMRISAALANPRSFDHDQGLAEKVSELESWIDKIQEELPELHNFIIPGGSRAGALLHLARTVCRRSEREVVRLSAKEKVDPEILIYLNRLSDLLFVLARWVNKKDKQTEKVV